METFQFDSIFDRALGLQLPVDRSTTDAFGIVIGKLVDRDGALSTNVFANC